MYDWFRRKKWRRNVHQTLEVEGLEERILLATFNPSAPEVTLSSDLATIGEAGEMGTVTATLSGRASQDVAVNLRFSGSAENGSDYTPSATQIMIPAGDLEASFTLTALEDTLVEGKERIAVNITSVTNAVENGVQREIIKIRDNDRAVLAIQKRRTVGEHRGTQPIVVTLRTSDGNGGTATLAPGITLSADVVDTGRGSASSGADYEAFGAQAVPFGPGSGHGALRHVNLAPMNDALVEGNEKIKLRLQNLNQTLNGQANWGNRTNVTTINDNDRAWLGLQSSRTVREQEGTRPILVTLRTSDGDGGTAMLAPGITLSADVVDTGRGSATSGADYEALGAQAVSFGPGSGHGALRHVNLTPINDALVEGNETVRLRLQNLNRRLNGQAGRGNTVNTTTLVDNVTDPIDAPTVSLTAPLDNGSRDVDLAVDAVTTGFELPTFEIQLADGQTGIDDSSVTTSSVAVTRDTVTLVEGVDYTFTYNATSDRIRLEASQLFDQATYQIQVSGIQDLSANAIMPTTLDVIIDRTQATSFSIVMLPDTQGYSQSFPAQFNAQTQWVADHITTDNLVFLTHMGDIVQTGTNQTQWEVADTAMSVLDGVIPYAAGPGNHDYSGPLIVPESGPPTVSEHPPAPRFVEFFGASRYDGYSWYGGSSADELNHFQIFDAAGFQVLHITLEFEPRDTALAWAQGVIDAHAELPVVLSTHAYLKPTGARFTQRATGDGNSGEDIFQKLVKPNQQVFMVLSGHCATCEGRNISTNDFGQEVFEIQADYQFRPNGGDGWMRLMKFRPNDNRINVRTYSPTLDRFETDSNSQFSIDINFAERFDGF